MNVWKESFLIKIRFLTRNYDLRKVAGNWTTYCTVQLTSFRFSPVRIPNWVNDFLVDIDLQLCHINSNNFHCTFFTVFNSCK